MAHGEGPFRDPRARERMQEMMQEVRSRLDSGEVKYTAPEELAALSVPAQQELAVERQQIRRRQILERFDHAGLPPRFRGKTFDNWVSETAKEERFAQIAQDYARNFRSHLAAGDGLLFVGPPGVGKTHLAVAIAQAVLEQGYIAVFSGALRFAQEVRESYIAGSETTEKGVISKYADPDLLVLDELGQQRRTDAELLVLSELVNRRYENQKPTIFLGNVQPSELKDVVGERAADRMRETCRCMDFEGISKRGRRPQGRAA